MQHPSRSFGAVPPTLMWVYNIISLSDSTITPRRRDDRAPGPSHKLEHTFPHTGNVLRPVSPIETKT
jgi:hypothetical protein